MSDIFLSYSNVDRPKAELVQAALQNAGFSVFWDQETPPGRDWNSWLGEKLAQSRIVVVLWSKASVQSRNVVHEATIALEKGEIIPAMIESLRPEEFPMGFFTVQAVDLVGFSGTSAHPGFQKLVAALTERLGQTPRPAAAAASASGSASGRASAPAAAASSAAPKSNLPLLVGVAVALALMVGGAFLAAPYLSGSSGPTDGAETTAPPAAEAPSNDAPSIAEVASDLLTGDWTWSADCTKPTTVRYTSEGGEAIIFQTPGAPAFKHTVLSVEGSVIKTRVEEPESSAGDEYVLTRSGEDLELKTGAEVNHWTLCPAAPG